MKTYFLKCAAIFSFFILFNTVNGIAAPPNREGSGEDSAFARATVPLNEYLELKKKVESPNLTSIEEVSITGQYQKHLVLKISGSSAGVPASIGFLSQSPGFNLSQCSGDAVLHLVDHRFALLPTAKRFKMNCNIQPKNWSELRFMISNSILAEAKVEGMEAIVLSNEQGHQEIALSPIQKKQGGNLGEISAIGRYQISVLPEEARYIYLLQVNNPNSGTKSWDLNLKNGEIVQRVEYSGRYEELGEKGYRFQLNPGESRIVIRGSLKASNFRPPLSGQQYLLMENHPTLQVKSKTNARRISPSDTGMQSSYPGARGYLLDANSSTEWESQKLQTFSAMGYSISRASYLIYVPESGKQVVEATLQIDNQGSPEIPLQIPGQATYLEVNNQPHVLTKDADNNLLLQLETGRNNILVQYQPSESKGGPFSFLYSNITKPNSVMSNVEISLALPEKWSVAGAAGLNDAHTDLDGTGLSFIAIITWVLLYMFGWKVLGWSRQQAILSVLLVCACSVLQPITLPFIWAMAFVLGMLRYRNRVMEYYRANPKKSIAVAVVMAGFVLIIFSRVTERFENAVANVASKRMSKMDSYQEAEEGSMADAGGGGANKGGVAPMAPAPMTDAVSAGAANGDAFQGLPSRITIPHTRHLLHFSQGMLDEKQSVRISALLISRTTLAALALMLFFFAARMYWRSREQILRWVKLPH